MGLSAVCYRVSLFRNSAPVTHKVYWEAWALLEPLTLIVIYSVIFSQLMRPGLSGYDQPYAYTVFLCSGLLMWMFFVELLTRSVGLFVENGDLLKKVQFPRLTLLIIALLAALLNYAIIMLWFVMLLVWADFSPGLW